MNPRQSDLFLYGTESLICPINRKGSWVGCLGWQRGWARTFFLSNFFPFQPFSFISDKNRLMNVPNSYFFLNIFKNRLKWIKNPNLHDSLSMEKSKEISQKSITKKGEFILSVVRIESKLCRIKGFSF